MCAWKQTMAGMLYWATGAKLIDCSNWNEIFVGWGKWRTQWIVRWSGDWNCVWEQPKTGMLCWANGDKLWNRGVRMCWACVRRNQRRQGCYTEQLRTNWWTVQTGTRCVWGEAGNTISELCAGRATKIVCVGLNKDRGALLSSWGQTVKHGSENLIRQL